MSDFTVIIPCRNGAATLPAALDSLKAQSFGDWRAIVIDDGSSDATPQILAAEEDPRVASIRAEGVGPALARNLGAAEARSPWLDFLDADDLWPADRLSALAIWNSPHDRGEQAQKLVEDRAAQVRAQGTMSTLPAAIERWFTPGFRASQPGRVDLVRQWRQRVDLEGYAQTAWVLAGGVPELVRPARAVTAPTLVMTAERDSGSTPAMAQAIAAEIPGARTEIVPDLQHLGLMEDPEAFAAPTLDFLKRTLL